MASSTNSNCIVLWFSYAVSGDVSKFERVLFVIYISFHCYLFIIRVQGIGSLQLMYMLKADAGGEQALPTEFVEALVSHFEYEDLTKV